MTDPYYNTSIMKVRTATGWRTVGLADTPIFILTPSGWRPFPASHQPVKMLTPTGFVTVIAGF